MKIAVLYLHVSAKSDPSAPDPSYYLPYSLRFARTFEQYPPGIDHELVVVSCGKPIGEDQMHLYRHITDRYECYEGTGWDISAHQSISKTLDCDWVVCLATPVYFHREGWLKRFSEAFERNGDGLYGAFGSYENRPHIRTSCFAFKPDTMRAYPHKVESREHCFNFECGCDSKGVSIKDETWCFTNWMIHRTGVAYSVDWSGVYPPREYRSRPNIFRRGDQSNCIVWDRHCDLYFSADQKEKTVLEALADKGRYP